MWKRLGVLALLLVLAGCADVGSSGSPSVPTAVPEESPSEATGPGPEVIPVEWDRLGEAPPIDLCPPDGPATDRPAFAPNFDDSRVLHGFVKHGVVANPQGELFRIDVNGQIQEAIQAYTDEVRVCLDAQFSDVTSGDVREGAWPEEPAPLEEFPGVEDLLIEVSLMGFVDPNAAEPARVAEEIALRPLDAWPTPDDAHQANLANNYLIDFVIDPRIAAGVRHQYVEKSATKVTMTLSALQGHVVGGLCRNSWLPFKRGEVGVNVAGVPTTMTLSDVQSYGYLYDLAVRGKTASTYRVSGTFGWATWFAGYWDSVPAGSKLSCMP